MKEVRGKTSPLLSETVWHTLLYLSVMKGWMSLMRTSAAPRGELHDHSGGRPPRKCRAASNSWESVADDGTISHSGKLQPRDTLLLICVHDNIHNSNTSLFQF